MSTFVTIVLLIGATFISEDLACITSGQLVARHEMHWLVAVSGCLAGIFIGDMGLWLTGRLLGRRVLRGPWIARRLSAERFDQLGDWLERNTIRSVFAARFLPGTRLPLYLAAGTLGRSGLRFACGTFLAAAVWTPALVLAVALLGDRVIRPFTFFVGSGWLAVLSAAIVCLALLKVFILTTTEIGRAKLVATVSLLWRWEFWPMILFYPPVALWVAWLSLRHRGFTTITAANPGIPHGGFVGESKSQILRSLRSRNVILSELIEASGSDRRMEQLGRFIQQNGLSYPVILKPDIGQRGAGVRLIHARDEAIQYLAAAHWPVLVQPYHPGPFEAGIFYYRIPGQQKGRIFSITDKHFSHLAGDGSSTVEQLIWRHPRYRMQAATFIKRHAAQLNRVLGSGEVFNLALAGNHCQGTCFRDGAHLITPRLETKIDEIAQTFDGFHFGRFDVRYRDVEAFKRGEDLTVIELNGITSESTNIYDPSRTLIWAYRMLFAQWSILFRIGRANRRLGHSVSGHLELLKEVARYFGSPRAGALAD